MSTLAEIEAAAAALPPEQKVELIRFLAAGLERAKLTGLGARLVRGPDDILLLEASPGSPPMTTERVKQLLEEFP